MTNQTAADAKLALAAFGNPERAGHSSLFFKTGPGQYGEGDYFMGATVPQVRIVAKQFANLELQEIGALAHSGIHEERLLAAIILSQQFAKASNYKNGKVDGRKAANEVARRTLFEFWLKLAAEQRWNNWDLIDTSAPYFGLWLIDHPNEELLTRLAHSDSLWDRRISIMFTFAHIRAGILEPTLRIASILHGDKHDLIHKAVGWMLREMGKQNLDVLLNYLDEQAATMPRTMLRYAIEKLTPEQRTRYLELAGKSKVRF
jgi:3-methyladenine DNA glycosylase AlkD